MIEVFGFKYDKIRFPVGELHVRITEVNENPHIHVEMNFESNDDIIELLLIADALKREGYSIDVLTIPYVPFGRQDRVAVRGECFSLKVFADLVNSIKAKTVLVADPHSDVTMALIDNCYQHHQADIFKPFLQDKISYYLVSPDGGALKKIYKLASVVGCLGVIECSKIRNVKTGEITGVEVHFPPSLADVDVYCVDDICDGGRTFIEIAKVFKKRPDFKGKFNLMITHGFFTKGLEVFDGLVDEIYTRKGQVK